MIAIKLEIGGKVQGVYYRQETQKMANALGLAGWVKNNEDSTVTVIAEGKKEMVYKLIDFCHHGPEMAVVKNVSITQVDWTGFSSFEIVK